MAENKLLWQDVLKKKQQIVLSMSVARAINEDGFIIDQELWRRNGSPSRNGYARFENVNKILDYDHTQWLPKACVKIIAEFAKPFVPGLTKELAPRMRDKYVKQKTEELQRRRRIDEATMSAEKRNRRRQRYIAEELHPVCDITYKNYGSRVLLPRQFYIDYLAKKLSDKEYRKKFVRDNVIIVKKTNLGQVLYSYAYRREDDKALRASNIATRHHVSIFKEAFPSSYLMYGHSVFTHDCDCIDEMIRTKAREKDRVIYGDVDLLLVKRKNKLYLLAM
jgi:hypothetical protein